MTREDIRRLADVMLWLCIQAGAELKTCYTVAALFVGGLEREWKLVEEDA